MTKIISKILLIVSISSFVLFFNSDNSKSCSFDFTTDDYYSVFDPAIFNMPSLTPFFLSELLFFPERDSSIFDDKLQNLNDWKKYFNSIPEIKDIESIIYPTTQDDIREILFFFTKHKSESVEQKYKDNSLFNYWLKNPNIRSIEYILYAKECEPLVADFSYWDIPQRDTVAMIRLIERGDSIYKKLDDPFLKLRYAFQIIRLSHYTGNYEMAVKFYDDLVTNLKVNSIIKYWALSLKAGALYRLGRIAESNYFFSVVFDNYAPKRFTASLSFKVKNDSLLLASLKLCKNNQERAALWMLAAYKNPEISLKSMQQIYNLDPKSPYLELLLEREVSRFETKVFPSTYYFHLTKQKYPNRSDEEYIEHGNELLKIVKEFAESKNTLNPHLWYLAAGYLLTLTGDTHNASPYFFHAKDCWPKDDAVNRSKIRLFEEMNDALHCIYQGIVNEESLVPHLKWLFEQSEQKESEEEKLVEEYYIRGRNNAVSAFIFVRSKLAQTYACNGEFLKMHLCLGDSRFGYSLEENPKNEPLDNLIAFFDKPKKTEFEELLQSMYVYKKNDLLAIKGTVFISQHKFKEAIDIFTKIGISGYLQADPFVIHINDCHDCDIRDSNKTEYTQLSFAKRMLELDSLSKVNGNKASEYYFLMANGFYNISYFGNCWNASSYFRDFDYDQLYNERKDWEFYDCSKAEEYYLKAIELTKDKEFAAKCYFMASKCEQNSFYNNLYRMRFSEDETYFKEKLKYRKYFKILKDQYANTKFFKEALKECKYFNSFVTKKLD